ncbi:MAG: membrane protein insertase YidC [Cytophagales bacterium]|nr:membrane protein insertase YidC [Cytophagales bacterium]
MGNVEKSQLVGTLLLVGIFLIYFLYFIPDDEPRTPKIQEQIASQTNNPSQTNPKSPEKIDSLSLHKKGPFANLMTGNEKEIEIENEYLHLIFSSKGGKIKRIQLKNYKTYPGKPLYLQHETKTNTDLSFTFQGENISFSQLYFTSRTYRNKVSGEDSLKLVFIAKLPHQQYIKQVYTIWGKRYEIKHQIENKHAYGTPLNLSWYENVENFEKNEKDMLLKTTLNYFTYDKEFETLEGEQEKEQQNINTPIAWIALKQKFFLSALIPSTPITQAKLSIEPKQSPYVKQAKIDLQLSPGPEGIYQQRYYMGPNDIQILPEVTQGFSQNISLGWWILAYINKGFLIPVFQFLKSYISNFGILIIIMVLVIRLVLAPLTYRAFIGMAKIRILKPEMDRIKESIPNDPKKQQQELMKVYQDMGVNPLSGCFPMILQMPILLSMFYFFPNAFDFRQEPFLWAEDLSSYDSILQLPFQIPMYGDHVSLFTLLMTISTLLYTRYNAQVSTSTPQHLKMIQYIMPFTFLFFLNSYSAALTFYYFISNIFSMLQQFLTKYFVNDEKIKAKLEASQKNYQKKKNKTTSFQERIKSLKKAQRTQ